MKGAIALPSAKTIKAPNNKRTKIIGANQNFFRTLIKSQRSLINSIIKMAVPYEMDLDYRYPRDKSLLLLSIFS